MAAAVHSSSREVGEVQLENSFTVAIPVARAWEVLLDIERIAPCMPGAALDIVDGDDFSGRVKVKLGPITLTYQGNASFVEKDESARRAVIKARGKDQRGNGTASATVTAQLTDVAGATRVDVLTDLDITGRPAQFGRGVMVDVGNKLIGQFADRLATQLSEETHQPQQSPGVPGDGRRAAGGETSAAGGPGRAAGQAASVGPHPIATEEPEPIDLAALAGGSVAARLVAPALAIVVLLVAVLWRTRRRSSVEPPQL